MAQQPSPPVFTGYVVEVESYTRLRAHIIQPRARLLRYGALALVRDPSSSRSYLALVEDVSEKTPVPLVDEAAVQRLYQSLARQPGSPAPLQQVIQQLLSPSQGLIRWGSIREAKLRVLGEVRGGGIQLPEEPPRPMSIVEDPAPQLLQSLLGGGLGPRGLYIGELAYNPGVRVYLDPHGLTTHMAIIGQTGSGKSETVKRLAAEYAWRKHLFSKRGGVVVMDISGEYTGYPYTPPTGVPLLDAVLRPSSFTGLQAQWLAGARKTILVPYDLATIPSTKDAEKKYAARLQLLIDNLRQRFPEKSPRGLLYARHGVYLLEPHSAPREIGRGEAARLLGAEELLVVAAPLPDSMSVEALYALSGSRSEQLPLVMAEAADRLGVLEVESLATASGFLAIVEAAWRLYNKAKADGADSRDRRISEAAQRLRRALEHLIQGIDRGASPARTAIDTINRYDLGFINYRALLNIAALPAVARDPAAELDSRVIKQALDAEHPWPGRPWRTQLPALAEAAAREILGQSWQTTASLARAAKRLSRMISPWLDQAQYRLLAERLAEGFTIIHLAEPSRGDTTPHTARLLEEIYTWASTGYTPDTRTLIVVEEAHNLAPAAEETPSRKALLRIAREGRKWGLSLVLVTQRPGFIAQDILSQAATLAALRTTNPDDITSLRRSVESTSQELADRLPDLDPGQAILSGPALPQRRIPALVQVARLTPLARQGGQP